jgi:UDPglucose 6-dehydrogenase
MTTYSVIGLGKLGACMAAAMAARGLDVIGADLNPQAVEDMAAGRAPVAETGLEAAIRAGGERLRSTADTAEAVAGSDVTFVVVPTPSDDRGAFSIEHARSACWDIGRALSDKDRYHLVVLTSTVLPGSSRHGLIPVLEEASGKRAGRDFGFCYGPEFIALGSVIHDFLNPDFLLIGELDERSGDLLEEAYGTIVENGAPCKRMSIENGELAKISLNAFVTMKIAFANTIAEVCERLPGGDVDAVTGAIGIDHRVGRAYLKGGLGFGGPCFPRDNRAFAFLARELGVDPKLAEATQAQNSSVVPRIVAQIEAATPPGASIAVLGLAFKPSTGITEKSQALEIARRLAVRHRVVTYDPFVRLAPPGLEVAQTLEECLAEADLVVVASPDPSLRPDHDQLEGKIVIDLWRILSDLADRGLPGYSAVGRGQGDGADLAALWAEDLKGQTSG